MDELYNVFSNQIASAVNYNNAFNAEQAEKQMAFQREMSNTAHVREIADLKAAGLNPVLSAKLGGASTPAGSSASADTSGVSAMASLATEFMRQVAEGFANGAVSGGVTSAKLNMDNPWDDAPTYDPSKLSKYDPGSYVERNGQHYKVSDLPEYQVVKGANAIIDWIPNWIMNTATKKNVKDWVYGHSSGLVNAGSKIEKATVGLANAIGNLFQSSAKGNSKADVSVMSYRRGAR